MPNSEYWRKRFEQLEEMNNETSMECYKEIEKVFQRAISTIQSDIEKWYNRLMDNNGVSYIKAKQMLNKRELEEFKWSVEDYIKYGKQNAITNEWMKELENASARAHIEQLEAIKIQLQNQLEVVYGNLEDNLSETLERIYKDTYYKTAYEVQKGFQVGSSMAIIDKRKINELIKFPWASDSKNFSQRIWSNKEKLINTLNVNLTHSIIRGEDPQKAINQIAKVMNTSKVNAGRLVMTESAFIASAAQKECFKDLDVEQYEIVATLDSHTSETCRELDGKVFDMKDYQVGSTAPPFHVNCRTTTCPYFDDEFTLNDKRAARGEGGEVSYVPANMSYKEWYGKYVLNKVEPVQNYKPIELDTNNPKHEKRGSKDITMYYSKNTINNIYISKEVKLKRKQLHEIDSNITKSLKKIKAGKEKPNIAIISAVEMQTNALASYNPVLNVIYINDAITDKDKLLELQKDCACPDNKLSTYVHELLHWKDATQYRQQYGAIKNNSTYINILRKKHKKQVDILEKRGYNINGISTYAYDSKKYNAYDEIFTEYRVKEILGG